MWEKPAFLILAILYTASLLLFLFLGYNYVQSRHQLIEAAKNQVQQETHVAVKKIDNILSPLSFIAHALAHQIGSGQLPRSQIKKQLELIIEKTPDLFGIGVGYIPYLNDPQSRRRSPYYVNRENTTQIEKQDWLQLFVTPCSNHPPTTPQPLFRCVVFIEYSLKELKALISGLDLGKTGYGFILSKQGLFLSHPIENYVKNRISLFTLAQNNKDRTLKRLIEHAVNNKKGVIEYTNTVTKQSAWIVYQVIPTTGWIMNAMIIKNELLAMTFQTLKHKEIWLMLCFILFLIFFLALLLRAYQEESVWQALFSTTLLLIFAIAFIWYFTLSAPYSEKAETAIIVDQAGLNQFLSSKFKPLLSSEKEAPLFIPTGVSIDTIAFSEENKVTLTGHIWQKYDDNLHKDITRGILLPDANAIDIKEAYRRQINHQEEIRWSFKSTLRQHFDYSKYPIDKREINLLIYPKERDKKIILIPDLEAYQWINPGTRPGVKRDLDLPGWKMKSSFFNYRTQKTSPQTQQKQDFPNFYFTLFIQREFLNPTIASLLPLVVVGLMLFALQLLLGKVKTITNVIAPLGALFFGTILAHIGLRQEIQVTGIIYIEYFYWVMYIAILLVTLTYYLFHTKSQNLLLYYHNGLIVKWLFWPLILGSLLGITVWKFYDI